MVKLPQPHGATCEMEWSQVRYRNHNDFIDFEIVPMLKYPDLITVPNKERWESIADIFPLAERKKMLLAIKRIHWKRRFEIVELDIEAVANQELGIDPGTLESTDGYQKMTAKNLFDPTATKMSAAQVKRLYCKLEVLYAEAQYGTKFVPSAALIEGSVSAMVTIPALEKNPNVTLIYE